MANEITFSDLDTNGGRVSEVLGGVLQQKLHDPSDLRAVMSRVEWAGGPSDTMQAVIDASPNAFSAASSETSGGFSNTDYDVGEVTLTVARYGIQYQASDLMGLTAPDGGVDLDSVARVIDQGVGLTFTDLLVALFPSLSTAGVDTTGTDLDVAGIEASAFALMEASVPGPYTCVLYPVQMTDFKDDLASTGTGVYQYQEATRAMSEARGPGFQGSWQNIEFWSSDSVEAVNTNADSNGAMFGAGCFAYTMADPALQQGHIPEGNLLARTDEIFIEIDRDAGNGLTSLIGNLYPAVAEAEDARGVKIITDR